MGAERRDTQTEIGPPEHCAVLFAEGLHHSHGRTADEELQVCFSGADAIPYGAKLFFEARV